MATETQTRLAARIGAVLGDDRRVAGLAFVGLAAEFTTALMLAAAMAPGYDFGGGAISDLGVMAETSLLFNGSLVFVGGLTLLGGWAFYRVHSRRWLFGVFAVAAVGAAGTGVFPLSEDVHGLFALLAFVGFNLAALGTAAVLRGTMGAASAVAGVVGLVFVVLMVVGDAGNAAAFGPIGHGGTERMIVYPPMLWLLALGGYLLGTADTEAASTPSS